MNADALTALVVIAMALTAYATRVIGVHAMRFVRLTPRFEAFLRAVASSVLVALVVPATLKAGPAGWVSVGVGLAVAAKTGNSIIAVFAGTAVAAAVRAMGLP
jgi:uncharacterized membrane protein